MCGEQVVEQYSRLGLAKDVYVMLLVCTSLFVGFSSKILIISVLLMLRYLCVHPRSCWMRW